MKALIVVDVQNDFCPGGSLAVPNGNEVIPVINSLLPKFDLVIFTKDWHPENHHSFASQNDRKKPFETATHYRNGEIIEVMVWPEHCVQGTPGADIHKDIDFSLCKKDFYIFKKGDDPNTPGYSAFENENIETEYNDAELTKFLDEREVDEVFICGLATDYCVKETAIEASSVYGYNTRVIIDACRSISPDLSDTLEVFLHNNIKVIESWELDLFNAVN